MNTPRGCRSTLRRPWWSARSTAGLLAILLATSLGGCARWGTEFYITDHRAGGAPEQYFERFDNAYYCRDASGAVELVMVRDMDAQGDGSDPLTQVIHIRQMFSAIPGTTYVDKSMINATVSYLILGSSTGASFEGGGFITFSENRQGDEIVGKLESSALTPQRRQGDGAALFELASLTGRFVARRDKRQVVRIVHQMRRLFGPLPPYQPAPVDPNLR